MAREQYLRGVDPEELKPSTEPPKPLTFWQKLQNFWYAYKVPVIIGVIVLVVAIFLGVMIASREKVDYRVALVTKGMIGEAQRVEMEELLEQYGEDLDGDGTVNVQLVPLAMSDPGDYVELSTIFSAGDVLFFIMEPEYYQSQIAAIETEDTHYFTELKTDAAGLSDNGRYWNWKDSTAETTFMAEMPKNLYFGVRLPIGTASGSKNKQVNADCVALLEKMIASLSAATEAAAAK